jgi:hypothetical protein
MVTQDTQQTNNNDVKDFKHKLTRNIVFLFTAIVVGIYGRFCLYGCQEIYHKIILHIIFGVLLVIWCYVDSLQYKKPLSPLLGMLILLFNIFVLPFHFVNTRGMKGLLNLLGYAAIWFITVFLLMFVVEFWQHADSFTPKTLTDYRKTKQSDDELKSIIIGTWVYEPKMINNVPVDLYVETTLLKNGDAKAWGTHTKDGIKREVEVSGTWVIKSGNLITTVAKVKGDKSPKPGDIQKEIILSISANQMITVDDKGRKFVMHRKEP